MLKQGTKLKDKGDGEECHIGGVLGEVYLIISDMSDQAWSPHTESEIRKNFDIIEEKWEPKIKEKYWFLNDLGASVWDCWDDDKVDRFRRDNLGIYSTEEEVPTSYKFQQ